MGARLCERLAARGTAVRALVRPGSEARAPRAAEVVAGDPLDAATYRAHLRPGDVLVQLVGTPHPSPSKAASFRSVDRAALFASVAGAERQRVARVVYVSVAQPAPVMRAYVAIRAECEARVRASGLDATILRPWYVLGPGRAWPRLLAPLYWAAERVPATRPGALRLGLVTEAQMLDALVRAVDSRARGVEVVDVPAIRGTAR